MTHDNNDASAPLPAICFFGVRHYGSVEKLVQELDSQVSEDTDALFIERPANKAGWKSQGVAFLKNPAMFALIYLYSIVAGIFAYAKNQTLHSADSIATNKIAEKHALEVYDVDKDIFHVMNDQDAAWLLLSWLLFLFALVEVYQAAYVSPWSFGGTLIETSFAILIILGYPFLNATISERNSVMLARIVRISKDHNLQNVVMVTGGLHLKNFEDLSNEMGLNYSTYEVPYTARMLKNKLRAGYTWLRDRYARRSQTK